jgi:hypothetical protein
MPATPYRPQSATAQGDQHCGRTTSPRRTFRARPRRHWRLLWRAASAMLRQTSRRVGPRFKISVQAVNRQPDATTADQRRSLSAQLGGHLGRLAAGHARAAQDHPDLRGCTAPKYSNANSHHPSAALSTCCPTSHDALRSLVAASSHRRGHWFDPSIAHHHVRRSDPVFAGAFLFRPISVPLGDLSRG